MFLDISQNPTSPSVNRLSAAGSPRYYSAPNPAALSPVRSGVPARGKLGDVSQFRTKLKPPVQFEFSGIEAWSDFSTIVQKNLSRVRLFNDNSWELSTDSQFVPRIGSALSTLLEKNNIQAKYLSVPPPGQIGPSSVSVTLNNSVRPVLVGMHNSSTELGRLSNDELLLKVLNTPLNDLGKSDKVFRAAIDKTTQSMLVNDLRLGYLSTTRTSRFFFITKSEGGNELKLLVSEPVAAEKFVLSLLALTLEVYFSTPYIAFPNGLEINAITRPDPPIHGLSKQPAAPGKVRWWVVNKLNRLQYYLHFNSTIAGCYYFKPVYGMYLGTLYESSEPELQQAVMCKVAVGPQQVELLENEASVFEFMESKRVSVLPQRLLYGSLFNTYHVLAFRPFGRPITRQDLSLKTMDQMRYALQTLHVYNFRHRDIRLESFYIDYDDTVRIANLGRAQRFKSLPDVARQAELEQLEQLFK